MAVLNEFGKKKVKTGKNKPEIQWLSVLLILNRLHIVPPLWGDVRKFE